MLLKNRAWGLVGCALAIAAAPFVCGKVANAQTPPAYATVQPGSDFAASRQIPAGTLVKVIVLQQISSDQNQVGDQVTVRVAPDDESGVPKSLLFVGHIRKILPASNSAPGEIGVRFDGFAPAIGNWTPVGNAPVPDTAQASAHFYGGNSASGGKSDVGIGAAAGAVIGGSRKRKLGDIITGGLLGALGGYAVQKATTHSASDVTLKNGQEVSITLRRPITIRTEVISD